MLPWYIPEQFSCLAETVARSAAESTAVRKEIKYVELFNRFYFFPIAIIESHGPLNNKAASFLSDLGRRITISIRETPGKQVFFVNESPCHYKDSMLPASLILSVIYMLTAMARLVNAR